MAEPIQVDLPHKLGREEARRRIADNVHKLKDHIPGGTAQVTSGWQGDEMTLNVHAMGQAVEARVAVHETLVRCTIILPGLLAFFARPIEAMLRQKGGDLLLEDKRKD